LKSCSINPYGAFIATANTIRARTLEVKDNWSQPDPPPAQERIARTDLGSSLNTMEDHMKKTIILATAIAAMFSGAAFAQSSQGQGAAAAGVNGNGANAAGSPMQNERMRDGTTGMSSGSSAGGQNGSPTSPQTNPTSPTGRASEGQTAPK
jgi:hypothetical protein